MCTEAIVDNARGRVCVDTVEELAKQLGIRPSEIPVEPEYGDLSLEPDYCLCPVDFVRLAKTHGLVMRQMGWDDGHFGEIELSEPRGFS